MIGQDQAGEAKARDSSGSPVFFRGFWLDRFRNGTFSGQEEQRKTEFPNYHPVLVRHIL